MAVAETATVATFSSKRPARQPFPDESPSRDLGSTGEAQTAQLPDNSDSLLACCHNVPTSVGRVETLPRSPARPNARD